MRSYLISHPRLSFSEGIQLSGAQLQLDAGVQAASEEISHWQSLTAMSLGGLSYRLSGLLFRQTIPFLGKIISPFLALGSEVATYELSQRGLLLLSDTSKSSNLFHWSGAGGIWEGLRDSYVNFGFLKLGGIFHSQNLFLRHLTQDFFMVAGHEATAQLGWVEHDQKSFIEKLFNAERTNLQLGAAMAVLHRMLPSLSVFERNVQRQTQTIPTQISRARVSENWSMATEDRALHEGISFSDEVDARQLLRVSKILARSIFMENRPNGDRQRDPDKIRTHERELERYGEVISLFLLRFQTHLFMKRIEVSGSGKATRLVNAIEQFDRDLISIAEDALPTAIMRCRSVVERFRYRYNDASFVIDMGDLSFFLELYSSSHSQHPEHSPSSFPEQPTLRNIANYSLLGSHLEVIAKGVGVSATDAIDCLYHFDILLGQKFPSENIFCVRLLEAFTNAREALADNIVAGKALGVEDKSILELCMKAMFTHFGQPPRSLLERALKLEEEIRPKTTPKIRHATHAEYALPAMGVACVGIGAKILWEVGSVPALFFGVAASLGVFVGLRAWKSKELLQKEINPKEKAEKP